MRVVFMLVLFRETGLWRFAEGPAPTLIVLVTLYQFSGIVLSSTHVCRILLVNRTEVYAVGVVHVLDAR